jgi:microcystin-dependent protein
MAQPYVGEIRMFGGNFAPAGWMFCEGQLLAISDHETLFQLIGTTYGGDGQSTFALPDLRGRLPIHMGTGSSGTTFQIADSLGSEAVSLTSNHLAAHTHSLAASSQPGTSLSPGGAYFAASAAQNVGYATSADSTLPGNALGHSGGQAHNNMQPYLCVNFIISLFGLFPSPT